ncbi:MAG: hypothetical protein A3J14_01890 [Candidatus Levybacteria bacterium RIFCSPLOWO2_02_FULL_37_18]|nr:MAG: hypothetical protein A3J14_01890 [Candidatus Levybacteria bacterium RIFCSPLOWO2_02_FULL_37_18]
MKNIWIVIVNYNTEEYVKKCLSSIEKLEKENFSLNTIVVNNKSERKPVLQLTSYVRKNYPEIFFIVNEKNVGFSGGNNIGISFALKKGADYVLLLNSDTCVHPTLIRELFEVFEQDNAIGIVAPKIYFAKGFEFHKSKYSQEDLGNVLWYAGGEMDWKNVIGFHRGVDEVDHGQYDTVGETQIATGCCMIIKKEVFKKVGMFDERYFLYYEDADLSVRSRKAGFKILFTPRAFLWHKNASSTGGSGSALQDYYITRNRLLFGMTYAQSRSKYSLVKESMRMLLTGRKWQKRGVIDFYLRRFGKGSFSIA